MADFKHFSEYLAEAQAKAGATGNRKLDFGTPVEVAQKKSEAPNDFLSSAIDILSRPLYAVTNVPNQVLNEIQKANLAGNQYDVAGGIGNVLTSPFRGLLSNDVADKATTAQLIEKASDTMSQNDPAYKDVQNNVDPLIAGIAGFAGDVALDPLTYIPVAGWAGKIAQSVGKGAKALIPATEEARVAAANALRRSGDVAKTGADAEKAVDDLLTKYGGENVQDIKAAQEDTAITLPKGTTSETSAAEKIVSEAEKGSRSAGEAAVASKAKEIVPDIVEPIPAKITADSPNIDQILADLPKEKSGRSRLGAMGFLFDNVRKGKNVSTEVKTALSPEQWREAVRKRVTEVIKVEGRTPEHLKTLDNLRNPNWVKTVYAQKYLEPFNSSGGKTGLFGKPIAGGSGFASSKEWLDSLVSSGAKQDIAMYPESFKDRPFGQDYLTPAQAKEFLDAGTIDEVKVAKADKIDLTAQIEEGFAATGGATKVESANTGFVDAMRKALTEDRAGMDALFGSKLVGAMLKMSDDKLDSTAQMIQDIASGQKSLAGIVNWANESGANTTQMVTKFLSSIDPRLEDVVAYNLSLRKAKSEVNSVKRAEYAAAIEKGMSLEDMFVLSGVTSDAAERVKKWLPEYLLKTLEDYAQPFQTTAGKARTHEMMGEGFAYDIREFSSFDSWNMVQASMKYSLAEAKKMKLYGEARAQYVRSVSMTELAMAEKVMDNFGYPMWMGIPRQGTRFLISPSQVFSAIFMANPKLLNIIQFNGETFAPLTFVMDALTESMTLGKPMSRERLAQILTGEETKKYYASINKTFEHPETNGFVTGGRYGIYSKEQREALGLSKGDSMAIEYGPDDLIDMFHSSMPDIVSNVAEIVRKNTDDYFRRFKSEAGDMSNEALADLEALAKDPARMGRLLDYIDNLEQNISVIGRESATLDLSILRAIETTLSTIPESTTTFAKATAKGTKNAKKAYSEITGEKVDTKTVTSSASTAAKKAAKTRETAKAAVSVFDTKNGTIAKLIESGADSATILKKLKFHSASWRMQLELYADSKKLQRATNAAEDAWDANHKQIIKDIEALDKLEETRTAPEFKPEPAAKPKKTPAPKVIDKKMEEAAQPAIEEKLDEAMAKSDEVVDEAIDTNPALVNESPEVVAATKSYGSIMAGVVSTMKPDSQLWAATRDAFGRRLNRFHDNPRLAEMWHSLGVTVGQLRHSYTRRLHELVTSIPKGAEVEGGTSVITRVFSDMQRGVVTQGHEELSAALRQLTAEVHDISGDVPLFNDPFFRSQQGLESINEYLKMSRVPDEFLLDLNKAKEAGLKSGEDMWTAASSQWRELKVSDPIQYLAQRHAALMKMSLHMSTAYSFKRMAIANDLISMTEKPGFVKAKGLEGLFFKFLPEDTYFDATLMKELQHLSDISELSRSLDGRFGEIINKYIMPVQNTWKYAITLPRPGHHLRNAIGTLSLIFMAEGPRGFLKASGDAIKVLSLRNNYTDVDLFQALRQQGITDIPRGGDLLFKSKGVDVTNDWAYRMAQQEGLLPTYHVGEDYVDDIIPQTKFSQVLDKVALRGGKIEKGAGAISEYRDHHGRLQHFLQILRKHANDPNFKSMDDLVAYASKRVKKYNPDSTMLTAWEAKYMRTLIPFYSWFRGALPALIEATVLYPGRFMAFPKASFNMAYAMGVNPDTLYDPFPTDQMFPSFLREQIQGPVLDIGGSYFGMNPGIAAFDVYNQLGSDPVRGIAGMTSPLFRVPMELMSGGAWGTGAKIKDTSDYIDSSIPGVNYLSNVTGVSPTGSIASLLQGKGFDPQYQVAAGNKDARDQALSFINWFTGLGFQNYSKPNYINYAEIEKRNAAAKEGK